MMHVSQINMLNILKLYSVLCKLSHENKKKNNKEVKNISKLKFKIQLKA